MPEYVVECLEGLLKTRNIELKKAKILIVGVTYKRDIKDLRKSPSIDIIGILQKRNVAVSYFDPLIPYLKLSSINLKPIELKIDTLKKFDCVVIATDHSGLDYDFILKNSKLIFDTRGVYKDLRDKKVAML
jgi:UDP-N-acetyl-D-glucosamine dehydrogenase